MNVAAVTPDTMEVLELEVMVTLEVKVTGTTEILLLQFNIKLLTSFKTQPITIKCTYSHIPHTHHSSMVI